MLPTSILSVHPSPSTTKVSQGISTSLTTNGLATVANSLQTAPNVVFYPSRLRTSQYTSIPRSTSRVNMPASGNPPSFVHAEGEIVPATTVTDWIDSVPPPNKVRNTKGVLTGEYYEGRDPP